LRRAEAGTTLINATATTSDNWSGMAIIDANDPFTLEWVKANFMVPVAQQANGSCTGTPEYGSAWVGIDGAGSSDVMQDGIEFDAYCNAGVTTWLPATMSMSKCGIPAPRPDTPIW
jgi:hypothetical protein